MLTMKQVPSTTTAWEAGASGGTATSVENWMELVLRSCFGMTKWAWQMRKIVCEKMAPGQPKEYSVFLARNQNGCLRGSKRSDELAALSLCSGPVSLCSLVVEERVSLADPYGVAMSRLPLPFEVAPATGLVTRGNASFDFNVVMHEESGGVNSWELRPGVSTEARISELSVGNGLWSDSDRVERAESGDRGHSVNGERGSLEGTEVRPPPGGDDGTGAVALGVMSLFCPIGDAGGVTTQNYAKK